MTPDEMPITPARREPISTTRILLAVLLLAAGVAWFAGMRQAENAGRIGVSELDN
jgi:hypothetical protein